ncbi:MAG: hypothetical protein OCC45_16190 [Desulfotalea sp.]
MKIRVLVILLVLSVTNVSFAGNYTLTIGNKSHDMSLDEETSIKVGDNYFPVKITQKNTFLYTGEYFTFEHPKQYSPSKSNLGNGIFQTAMMTPLGSLVMIQEYNNLNPSNLIDLMIAEITKEERNYGYKIESSEKSITLADGKVLSGKIVTSKYKGSDLRRYFYTYGIKDSGLFIMTQVDYEIEPKGEEVIDMFLNSLKISIK